jgi:hypothetical protein
MIFQINVKKAIPVKAMPIKIDKIVIGIWYCLKRLISKAIKPIKFIIHIPNPKENVAPKNNIVLFVSDVFTNVNISNAVYDAAIVRIIAIMMIME